MCIYGYIYTYTHITIYTHIPAHNVFSYIHMHVYMHKTTLSVYIYMYMSFPGGTGGKEPSCQRRRHERCDFNP